MSRSFKVGGAGEDIWVAVLVKAGEDVYLYGSSRVVGGVGG